MLLVHEAHWNCKVLVIFCTSRTLFLVLAFILLLPALAAVSDFLHSLVYQWERVGGKCRVTFPRLQPLEGLWAPAKQLVSHGLLWEGRRLLTHYTDISLNCRGSFVLWQLHCCFWWLREWRRCHGVVNPKPWESGKTPVPSSPQNAHMCNILPIILQVFIDPWSQVTDPSFKDKDFQSQQGSLNFCLEPIPQHT